MQKSQLLIGNPYLKLSAKNPIFSHKNAPSGAYPEKIFRNSWIFNLRMLNRVTSFYHFSIAGIFPVSRVVQNLLSNDVNFLAQVSRMEQVGATKI